MNTANQYRNFRLALVGVASVAMFSACAPAPGTYSTPAEAVQALADLAGSGDSKKAEEMFGKPKGWNCCTRATKPRTMRTHCASRP